MAHADIEEVLKVERDLFYRAVTHYERYPEFVEGCTRVTVDRSRPEGPRVTYYVSLIKDISYTLEHTENPATGRVTWSLVSSDFLKRNVGHWEIESMGPGKTRVRYEIDIEFKIPVPGLILNRLVKSSLPSMIRNFERQAHGAS